MSTLRTLVIVPAFNEENPLPKVLQELAEAVPELDVLVVNDGSTDGTSRVAIQAGVIVASLPFNLGVGAALRTGFSYALRNKYDRAVQFDADGQHDASEIPKLLTPLAHGADMVVGSRFTTAENRYQPGRVRGGAIALLRLLVNLVTGQKLTDTSSGFRAFGRDLMEFFARTYPAEYLSDTVEALFLASYAGYVVVEVPTKMRYRKGGLPSTRHFKLPYHYIRLLIVIAMTISLKARKRRDVDSDL